MKILRAFAACLFLACLGCAGREKIKEAYAAGEGTSETYAVDPAAAFELCRTVLFWQGAKSIDEYPDENYMLCRIGGGLSYGCGVGVWLSAAEGGKTKVTVITKRNVSMSLTTGLTESTFHRDLATAAEIRASGRPVPVKKPEKKPE